MWCYTFTPPIILNDLNRNNFTCVQAVIHTSLFIFLLRENSGFRSLIETQLEGRDSDNIERRIAF
jgi:hypothetical protein